LAEQRRLRPPVVPPVPTPAAAESEATDGALARYLRSTGWIIDIDEYRNAPKRYGTLALPAWLWSGPNLWLVIPLSVHEELLGWVLLGWSAWRTGR